MKFSLGLWLAMCLAGLQFVTVTIIVSSSYVSSERVLLDHARSLLSDVAANTIAHSKGFLDPARGAAELAARLAQHKIVASDNSQLLERLLFQQLQSAPQFAGVFYGDQGGNFVYVRRSEGPTPFASKIIARDQDERQTNLIWRANDYEIVTQQPDPNDTYDPRTRPWYQSAERQEGSIWTNPYIFFTSQSPGITIAAPVFQDNEALQGVVGVDIEISAISDFLADLKIGESGVALIINRNGDVIAHPQQDLLKAANDDGTFRFVGIDEIGDLVAREAFGHLADRGEVNVTQQLSTEFTYDGADYVSTVVPVISEELPWTIAVYAPKEDFVGALTASRTQEIWIAALIAVLTGLVGLMIANQIHKPVRAFAVRAALISQGELDPSEPTPKTYRELDRANDALTNEILQRKNSEREYGLTFDLASRGMVQFDPETGRFLRTNPKFSEILGYSENELLTKTTTDLTHPDDPGLLPDLHKHAGEEQTFSAEKRCIRKDGEPIWVSINGIVVRDDQDKPLHAVATVDDITQNMHAEAQIRKLSRDLSHLARGEMLGQMAAGLAHELNQPLTAITQNVDAALITAEDEFDENHEIIQILKDLDMQSHRAGDIIKALRGFARKGEEWKSPFDIKELISQSLRLVQAEASEHGVKFSFTSDDLPDVLGIRVQIAQVIVNLLRNAIDAISESGDNQKKVTLNAVRIDNCIQVSVEDTGPGIDPNIDLFTQFETSKSDGMGLGLSICRSIVEAGGGSMWLDESTEKGARFCFTVPVA